MRAALHDGTTVANVIEYDPEADYAPEDGLELTVLDDDDLVGPGYRVTADGWAPPPVEALTGPDEVAVDDTGLVVYTNTHDDAPAEVTLDVNGATTTIALTDGIAELDVTVAQAGTITVVAVDRPVPALTIRGV